MDNPVHKPVNRWLRLLNVPVSNSYLRDKLLSHPDYPSLAAITGVLKDLNIESTAIEVRKDQFVKLPTPFLAHWNANGGEFIVVENAQDPERQFHQFFKKWKGVVVLAEKPEGWSHEENRQWLKREKNKAIAAAIEIILLFVFVAVSFFFQRQWQYFTLMFVAAAGIFVSWIIVSVKIGFENRFARQVWRNDCKTLIESKVTASVSWGDVALIWFSFLFTTLLVGSFTNTLHGVFYYLCTLATLSISPVFISIYYQWQVIKKWCRPCLVVASLLFLQFTVLSPQLKDLSGRNFSFDGSMFLVFLLFLVSAFWLTARSLIIRNKKIESESFANRRIKNDPGIFIALLKKQRRIDTTPFENDLQLGNPDARWQFVVACNPYCYYCRNAFEALNDVVKKIDIGLTVRFAFSINNNEQDITLNAVRYILQLLQSSDIGYRKTIFHDWYETMNFEEFSASYRIDEEPETALTGLLERHASWSEKNGIQFTPSIFINGYELPAQYSTEDLKELLENIELEEINLAPGRLCAV